jgi:hypothetical protein
MENKSYYHFLSSNTERPMKYALQKRAVAVAELCWVLYTRS